MDQKYHGYCEKLDLESVTFQSDAEVDGFIQLIKVGNLSLENNLFDLNAWRNEQNQFAFRGGFQSINTTFTKLKIIEDSEEFDCIGKDALYRQFKGVKLKLIFQELSYLRLQHLMIQKTSCTSRLSIVTEKMYSLFVKNTIRKM